jgi:hypothetical protein
MSAIRAVYLEVILHQAQEVFARMFCFDWFEMFGDCNLIVLFRGIFLDNARFQSLKDVFA